MSRLIDFLNNYTNEIHLKVFSQHVTYEGDWPNRREMIHKTPEKPINTEEMTADLQLQNDTKLITTEGIGDCGPFAVAQALLLEGLLQGRKDFVADFLEGAYIRNQNNPIVHLSEYSITKSGDIPLEFFTFTSTYRAIENEDEAFAFLVKHLLLSQDGYKFVKFIGACMRCDAIAWYNDPEHGADMVEEDKLQFAPKQYIDLSRMFEYLAGMGIMLSVSRESRNIREGVQEPRSYAYHTFENGEVMPLLNLAVMLRGRAHSDTALSLHYETMVSRERLSAAITQQHLKPSKPGHLDHALPILQLKTIKTAAPPKRVPPPRPPRKETDKTAGSIVRRPPPPPPPVRKAASPADTDELNAALLRRRQMSEKPAVSTEDKLKAQHPSKLIPGTKPSGSTDNKT